MICIKNGRLILSDKIEKDKSLFIEDNKIIGIGKRKKSPFRKFKIIDAKGLYISPGFIDIHVHGIFADRVNHLKENDLTQMCNRMAGAGVTSFLTTTVSLPLKYLLNATRVIKSFIKNNPNTNLLGLHLEGPYLNPLASGAQNRKYIRIFKSNELKEIFSIGKGLIKVMTFAPEVKNGMKLLNFLVRQKIMSAIGHSTASYKEVELAVKKGARHVTHLFNAMPVFHHRDPGLIGASLTLDRLSVDIIADGVHLHPATVKFVIETKGIDKVILISDSIATGKKITLGGLKVYIKNGQARLENGRLAGSLLSLHQAIKNVMEFADINLRDAVKMTTLNPARLLGIQDRKGSLEVGKDADIVIFDKDFKIRATLINGNVVFNRL